MSIKYLCGGCCSILGIKDNQDAVNECGRKCCSRCGDNTEWRLHIISDGDYTKAMEAQDETGS